MPGGGEAGLTITLAPFPHLPLVPCGSGATGSHALCFLNLRVCTWATHFLHLIIGTVHPSGMNVGFIL